MPGWLEELKKIAIVVDREVNHVFRQEQLKLKDTSVKETISPFLQAIENDLTKIIETAETDLNDIKAVNVTYDVYVNNSVKALNEIRCETGISIPDFPYDVSALLSGEESKTDPDQELLSHSCSKTLSSKKNRDPEASARKVLIDSTNILPAVIVSSYDGDANSFLDVASACKTSYIISKSPRSCNSKTIVVFATPDMCQQESATANPSLTRRLNFDESNDYTMNFTSRFNKPTPPKPVLPASFGRYYKPTIQRTPHEQVPTTGRSGTGQETPDLPDTTICYTRFFQPKK